MNATDTSRAAYHSIEHLLAEKQRKVCWALDRYGAMDNLEIAEKLGWEINQVTGRIKELREMTDEKGNPAPLVIPAGYTVTKSGRKAHLWKLKEEPAPKAETNSLF